MCKKIIYSLSILLVITIGFYCGIQVQEYQTIQLEDKSTISTIAVVNLDEGITVDKEKINYASKLIVFPDTDFIMTGLIDAREGIKTNKYAAYVIIPSTFSQSTISVNDKPQKANIEYEINANLREDIMIKVVGDINNFNLSLSSNMAYMYVSAILEEFHEAQDTAGIMIQNDSKDAALISSVAPETILAELYIPTLNQTYPEIPGLDLEEYFHTAEQTMNNVDSNYTESINHGKTELEKVREEEIKVTNIVEDTNTAFAAIDIEKNSTGTLVYQQGIDKLDQVIADSEQTANEYIDDIKKLIKPQVIGNAILQVPNKPQQEPISLQEKINNYNEELQKQLSVIQAEVTSLEKEIKIKTINRQIVLQEPQIKIQSEELLIDEEISVTEKTANVEEESNAEETSVMSEELPIVEETSVMPEESPIAEETSAMPEESPIAEETIDTKDNCGSTESIVETTSNIEKHEVYQPITQLTAVTISNAPPTAAEKLAEIKKHLNTISQNQINLTSDLDNLEAKIAQFPTIKTTELTEVIKEDVIIPIQTECKSEATGIAEKTVAAKTAFAAYEKKLNEYDPLKYINHESINAQLSGLTKNILEMESKINQTNNQYLKQMDKTYLDASNSVLELQQSLDSAYKKTGNNLIDTVDILQESRTAINQTNITMLSDLISKLPYTRLGSVEFTEAYDFIVNPISVKNKGSEAIITIKNQKSNLSTILAILCAILSSVILTLFILSRIKENKKQKTINYL